MKRIIPVLALLFASCNADPHIVPDPIDASVNESSSSSSAASSASSSASSSSSSSASSSSGGTQGDGSGARLKRKLYTSPDGLKADASGAIFVDSVLNIECTPAGQPNNAMHCVPYPALPIAYHPDAMCSGAAIAGSYPGAYTYAYHPTNGTWFHLGSKTVTAYVVINGNCVPGSPQYEYYTLGTEVDVATFAPISLVIE